MGRPVDVKDWVPACAGTNGWGNAPGTSALPYFTSRIALARVSTTDGVLAIMSA
jgi:hypothetical protein